MTSAPIDTLVVKDGEGNYFLVPLEALERGRVSETYRAAVEEAIAKQEDVRGHLGWFLVFAVAWGVGAGAIIENETRTGTLNGPIRGHAG